MDVRTKLVTKGLNRNERLIIILYYYEELTMKEIGNTLGLSESRVSQMHSSIVARLKEQLDRRRPELASPQSSRRHKCYSQALVTELTRVFCCAEESAAKLNSWDHRKTGFSSIPRKCRKSGTGVNND